MTGNKPQRRSPFIRMSHTTLRNRGSASWWGAGIRRGPYGPEEYGPRSRSSLEVQRSGQAYQIRDATLQTK